MAINRKLASIQRIQNIEPIVFLNKETGQEETAENIVRATVSNWHMITNKQNGFNVGDLCVFFEVDSIIPFKPWSEFLRDKNKPDTPIRLRTAKRLGAISQGLIMPLDILGDFVTIKEMVFFTPEENSQMVSVGYDNQIFEFYEGSDVTEFLGVEKWEPVQTGSADERCAFSSLVKKTDETRIQTIYSDVKNYLWKTFYIAEKIDGSSSSYYLEDTELHCLSKNLDLVEGNNQWWNIARKYDLAEKLKLLPRGSVLQGEIYSEGVQKNKYKMKGIHFAAFNIYNMYESKYYNYGEFIDLCVSLEIPTVPIIDDNFVFNHTVDEMVALSRGKSALNPDVIREGIVIRPLEEIHDMSLGRLSWKIINPDFSLKHSE